MASGSSPGLRLASMSPSTEEAVSSDFFGWDFLYKTVERVVKKKSDVVMVLAHFILVRHYQMTCIGIGDHDTFSEADTGSELLPDGWNAERKRYSLRYIRNGELYLLIADTDDYFISMNLFNINENSACNLTLNPKNVVTGMRGTIYKMIPDVKAIVSRFRQELVDRVFTGNTREVTTQTLGVRRSRPQHNPRDPHRFLALSFTYYRHVYML